MELMKCKTKLKDTIFFLKQQIMVQPPTPPKKREKEKEENEGKPGLWHNLPAASMTKLPGKNSNSSMWWTGNKSTDGIFSSTEPSWQPH